MKKVLLLTTTPTVGGNGDALIEATAETAMGCGTEVKRLNVREMDIHPCRAATAAPGSANACRRTISAPF